MKLNLFEKLITNNPVRASIQRHIEWADAEEDGKSEGLSVKPKDRVRAGIGAQVIVEQFSAQKVIATDIDPERIERARENLQHALRNIIEFKVADAMALDEPDEKFDAVFSFEDLLTWKTGERL